MKLSMITENDEYEWLEDDDEFIDENDTRENPCPDCDFGELIPCAICDTLACYSIEFDSCYDNHRQYNLQQCEVCGAYVCEECREEMREGLFCCKEHLE